VVPAPVVVRYPWVPVCVRPLDEGGQFAFVPDRRQHADQRRRHDRV